MPQLDPAKYGVTAPTTRLDPAKYKEENKESRLRGILRRLISGPSAEDLGGVQVITPGFGNEPLISRITDFDNSTIRGKVGNFAQDLVRGAISTPEGIIGSATTTRSPFRVTKPKPPDRIPSPRTNDIALMERELASPTVPSAPQIVPEIAPTPVITPPVVAQTTQQSVSLPRELAGAKPRYNIGNRSYQPQFESDLDKSLFIIAQTNRSRSDARYLEFVMKQTGLDETAARAAGRDIRNKLKNILNGSDEGSVNIPSLFEAPAKPAQITPNQPINTPQNAPRASAPRIRTSDPSVGRSILQGISDPQVALPAQPNVTLPPVPPTTTIITPRAPGFSEYANISKAFAASGDVSNPMRQSIMLMTRPEWWKSWGPMMRSLTSESKYNELQRTIASHPRFAEAVNNGLALTDFPGIQLPPEVGKNALKSLSQQEEQFASRVAERFTGGKYSPIRASNRAYTAFANNLRINVYDKLASQVTDNVVKRNIADYLNTATGRGSMGLRIGEKSATLEKGAELLNTVFWSPRFLASRVQILNPASYIKLDSFTRRQAARDLIGATGSGLIILEMAKLAGAEVDLNPTSTDFGKAKFGKTRVDLTGGFSPLIRFFAQAIDGVAEVSGKDPAGPDVLRFLRSKLSPSASLITDLTMGKDYLNREIEGPTEVSKRATQTFTPMILQDLYELYKEDPNLLGLGAVSAIGGSVQVHDESGRGNGNSNRPSPPRLRFQSRQ